MKNIAKFEAIVNAIAEVAKQKTVSSGNGTTGNEYLCYLWDTEAMFDMKRSIIERDIARHTLFPQADSVAEIIRLNKEKNALPKPKSVLIMRLLNPISKLKGTKVIPIGGKTYTPEMTNVEYLYIQEDVLSMNLMEYEETPEREMDNQGREQVVIKLVINDGLIDVKEGKKDKQGKITRMPRAYVYPVSARAMQITGKMMGNNTYDSFDGITENV